MVYPCPKRQSSNLLKKIKMRKINNFRDYFLIFFLYMLTGCNSYVSGSQSFFQIKFQYQRIKVVSSFHFSVDFSASCGKLLNFKTNK